MRFTEEYKKIYCVPLYSVDLKFGCKCAGTFTP